MATFEAGLDKLDSNFMISKTLTLKFELQICILFATSIQIIFKLNSE